MFRQLKYFMTVVDCNSFTEAAEQCFISQSAISQQISALENDLGIKLIKREKRRFSLTPAGEYLYHQCRGLLEQVEMVRRETVRIGQDSELRLRIGYLEGYEGKDLQESIYEFTALYPEVLISVVKYSHEDLFRKISDNEIDLVLSYQRRAFSEQYENFHLRYIPCAVEISKRNDLAKQDSVSIEQIREVPCILIAKKGTAGIRKGILPKCAGHRKAFLFRGKRR